MGVTVFDPIAVGDQRPIEIKVYPSDAALVASATYTITRYKDAPGTVWDPGGECDIANSSDGIKISTPDNIDFSRVDTYYARFSITWEDGVIDNTVVAQIPVVNPGGGCDCGC